MTDRPDYVCCISSTHFAERHKALCGRDKVFPGSAFIDIDHWFWNRRTRGRLIACQDCIERIEMMIQWENAKAQEIGFRQGCREGQRGKE